MDSAYDNYIKRTEDFFSQFTLRYYKQGETLVAAGEEPPGVFYLKEGRVRSCTISPQGNILTLHTFKPKEFFPLTWAMTGKSNRYSIEAVRPSFVYRAPREKLLEFLTDDSKVLYHLATQLLCGIDGLLTRIEMVSFMQAYGRVIFELLCLVKIDGKFDDKGGVTIGYMTHQEISEDIGVARETVSIAMKRLERNGLIAYVGRAIYVPSFAALERELKE